ncbi:hypothetical protein QZH41_019597, partial [Actinostola sp. cb2023]
IDSTKRRWYQYSHIGCFRDKHKRALAVYLRTFRRRDAVRNCAKLAWSRGYKVFSVQYGGQCFSGPVAYKTYYRYGRARNCRGYVGGTWANDVFFFNARRLRCGGRIYYPHTHKCCHNRYLRGRQQSCGANIGRYSHIGCFRDKHKRALSVYLGYHRRDSVKTCAKLAWSRGYKVFSVQYGGQCFSGPVAYKTYYRYGRARNCRSRVGGTWANDVFFFNGKLAPLGNPHLQSRRLRCGGRIYYPHTHKCCHNRYLRGRHQSCGGNIGRYSHIGCFKDKHKRALSVYLGYHRRDSVKTCAKLAWSRGYKVFSVQYGGQCFSGPVAYKTYYRYGRARNCRSGVGGTWANDVFFFNARRLRCGGRIYYPHTHKCCHNRYLRGRHQSCGGNIGRYSHIGCFKDKHKRALSVYLGYHRRDSVKTCAKLAWSRGYKVFSVQYGGQCFSGPVAYKTYYRYGRARNCRSRVGGTWANDVFFFNARRLRCGGRIYYPHTHKCCHNRYLRGRHQSCGGNIGRYSHIGCFKDKNKRALSVYLGYHRRDAVKTCAKLAWSRGYKVFSVQYGGQCFSGPVAYKTYYRYGRARNCRSRVGGTWANDVFFFNARRLRCGGRIYYPHTHKCCHNRYLRGRHQSCGGNIGRYSHIGCFRDKHKRALSVYLGYHRRDSVKTCAKLAWSRGYKVFSVQYGGQCFSGPVAYKTYYRYGRARNCRSRVGGTWANDVFFLQRYSHIGCFKDKHKRALSVYLGYHRRDSVKTCAKLAWSRGYKVFSVQYGGQCFSGPVAYKTYYRYGRARNCRSRVGGTWANDVFFFNARRLRCGGRIYYPHTHKCCHNRYLRGRHQSCGGNIGRYSHIGCFKDKNKRALSVYLGYHRRDSVKTCAKLAWSRGYKVFSVQYGGQCFSGPVAYKTYYRYGRARNCRSRVGGTWANDVFFFNGKLAPLGNPPPIKETSMWRKNLLPPHPQMLSQPISSRRDSVKTCAKLAWSRGYKVFSVQYGGQCFSGPVAYKTYYRYGRARNCRGYVGGTWANDVFFFNARRLRCGGRIYYPHTHKCCHNRYLRGRHQSCGGNIGRYSHIGCFRDKHKRALSVYLGYHRRDSVKTCAKLAWSRGYKVFSVQYGGQCFSGSVAYKTYYRYGRARNCRSGVGGTWANDVYSFI